MTLRDDIRRGFEREQSRLGEVGDARHRLMQDGLAARDSVSHRLQWMAGVAAVVIAALVIGTFAWVRSNVRQPVPGISPKAIASPTPLRNAVDVPDSTPLILFHDPENFDQLDGMTWDRKSSGRVGSGVAMGGTGNPQGSLYETDRDIRNRAGTVLETLDITVRAPFFADDGVRYCATVRTKPRDVSGPGALQTGTIGQPPRNVATVGVFGAAQMQGGGPTVIACSPASDRAVVYQAPPGGVGVVRFWVIQLSTGRKLWTGGGGGYIAASHDGRYIALADGSGQTVMYGPDGAALKRFEGEVFGFSWDGTLVVAAQIGGAQSPSIVNWSDGQTIWTCPDSTFGYGGSFAEPGGSRVAIAVLDPAHPQTSGFAPVDLFVVDSNGVQQPPINNIFLYS